MRHSKENKQRKFTELKRSVEKYSLKYVYVSFKKKKKMKGKTSHNRGNNKQITSAKYPNKAKEIKNIFQHTHTHTDTEIHTSKFKEPKAGYVQTQINTSQNTSKSNYRKYIMN